MPPYLLGHMNSINRDFVVHQVLDDRKNKSTVAVVTRRKAGKNMRRTVLKVFAKNDPGLLRLQIIEAKYHLAASQGVNSHLANYIAQFDYPEAFCFGNGTLRLWKSSLLCSMRAYARMIGLSTSSGFSPFTYPQEGYCAP